MKLSVLKNKAIINIVNGEVLGSILDLQIDLNNYSVKEFDVGSKKRFYIPFFHKNKNIKILSSQIESIGDDVILVRVK